MRIPFNRPCRTGREMDYIKNVFDHNHLSGNGIFTEKCQVRLEEQIGCCRALLTHSCTAALEMAAILSDIGPGDEVILPSYTFVSTANAFVLRGGVPVFVDIDPVTMNIDVSKIEEAVTPKTKGIVPVHYAGVSCDMEKIMALAEKHGLLVIEDAAQGILSRYKGRPLGSMGHLAALSFHETKNITSGEGGALLINDRRFIERAEIIAEKGTNRRKFLFGKVDKYSWVDIGSSYLPSEIEAAFLFAQMETADEITAKRMQVWNHYYNGLSPLAEQGRIGLPLISEGCVHNAHMFYIKAKDLQQRNEIIAYLKIMGISCVFHYVPLHSSQAGRIFGRFHGEDCYTTQESERLIRLPMFAGLEKTEVDFIIESIYRFFSEQTGQDN